jgi:subtilisin family serine protease
MFTRFYFEKRMVPQGGLNANPLWIVWLSLLVALVLRPANGYTAELRPKLPLISFRPTAETALSPTLVKRGAHPHVAGQILVRFKDGVSQATAVSMHAGIEAQVLKIYGRPGNLELVSLPAHLPVAIAIQLYRNNPNVLYAEPNYIVVAEVIPNDPLFSSQWNLHNTSSYRPVDIDAPEAWDITTGTENVVVAVIDTGIDYNHEDLSANVWKNIADCNSNGIDDDGNGYIDDCFGIDTINGDSDPIDDADHGTHVAGIIGATGNNAIGVAGVNWNVSVMACKFMDSEGFGTIAAAIECMDYISAMKDRGVNVIAANASWGSYVQSKALYEAIDVHKGKGILFVAAAGNDNYNNDLAPHYPSSYYLPNVISVAAINIADYLSVYSNWGSTSVHLGAPGDDIVSTTEANTYSTLTGTSMAAAHVSGIAALLKSQDPTRDWKAIKNLILAGGVPYGSNPGFSVTDRRANALGALTCSNAVVKSRLWPRSSKYYGEPTEIKSGMVPVNLAALHINCAKPNGNVSVMVSPGNTTVALKDDGIGFDQIAGDGIYSGQWTPSAGGLFNLTFPDGDVVAVEIDPDLKPGFPVKVFHSPGSFYAGPSAVNVLVGNIDNDPSLEIVLTGITSGPLYAWKPNGSLVPGWPLYHIYGGAFPTMGELSTEFPGLEVFAGYFTFGDDLAAYSGTGLLLPGWPRESANTVAVPASLADVDGDGLDEIFIGEYDWQLHAYKADGTPLPGWPVYVPGGQYTPTPAIADLDGDGDLEVVFPKGDSLFAYHHNGAPMTGFPLSFPGALGGPPAIGDVDGDGLPEIVIIAWDFIDPFTPIVLIISNSGQIARSISLVPQLGENYARVALADLDYDGAAEIIVQTSYAIEVFRGDGLIFPGWPVALPASFYVENSAPVIGDVDGDGLPDIVFTHKGQVHVYNRFGFKHSRFPKTIAIHGGGVPAIADIDLDGRNKIIITGDYWEGFYGDFYKVWVYDLGGPPHGTILWGQFMGGPKRQGHYKGGFTLPNKAILGVSKAGSGTGMVSGPGINCGTDCTETFDKGVSVTLTAAALAGSVFAGWSGGGCGGVGSCTVIMNMDVEVTAIFVIPPAISVTPSSQAFGKVALGSSSDRQFTVQNSGGEILSGNASVPVPFSIVSGGSYNLGAGQSQIVTVRFSPTVTGTFTKKVSFTGASGAERSVTGTGVAVPLLKFSAANYKKNEARLATISVVRSGSKDIPVTVDYQTSDGTAIAGSDYTATSGTLSFAAGETSKSFMIPIVNDTFDEQNKTVNLTLSNPTGGAVLGTPSTAVLTIKDDDKAGKLGFKATSYKVNENEGTATITVTRSRGKASGVTVDYTTSDGTATAGIDYTPASGTLTFAAGQTSQTFTIPITNDALVESNETIHMQLLHPTGGATLNTRHTAVLTIVDND